MKKILILSLILLLGKFVNSQTTIAGWTFPTSNGNPTANISAECGNGTIYFDGTNGSDDWLSLSGALSFFTGYALNTPLCEESTATGALGFVNVAPGMNNKAFVIKTSTLGFNNISIDYVVRRPSTGFTKNSWYYSTDGINFTFLIDFTAFIGTSETLASIDFTSISEINNKPEVYFKVVLDGATSNSGNNRFDNINIKGTALPTPIDWANLQWPPNGNINEGDNFIVYAQAWINGATQNTGATPGLECWIGYSTENTNPNTWTNWVPAVFNVDVGNNDEFMANIGTAIQGGGTYYYASRWRYNGGQYYYGGYNTGGGGFWDGTNNISGILTVNGKPVISNVQHSPIVPKPNQNVTVTATITDDGSVSSAKLFYSTTTPIDTNTASQINMINTSGNTYSATIPAHPDNTTIYYLIAAKDNNNLSAISQEYSYTVQSNALPVITNVSHNPTAPTSQDVVTVTADITDPDGSITSATIYYSTTSPVDPLTAQSSQMTLLSGDTYRGFIPAFANNTTVYYVIKAVDNENGSTISNEYSYTVTNPTATIQLAGFVPQENFDMIGIIFNSKVPQTATSNYKLYIGNSTLLQPLFATIMEGITNDTVLLFFTKNSIPQDIVLDTIVEEFYNASYEFYASVIPIKYTNTLNPDGTIQNNKTATFAGLVTADDEYNQVWIQDNCGPYNGVLVYSNYLKDYVNVGDQIYFIGSRTEYNGMTELIQPIVFHIEQNIQEPCVTEVASILQINENIQSNTNPAEKWEGQLIKVTNVTVTQALSNYEYRATDGQYTIIIDDDAWYHYGNTTPFELNKNYNITGVVTFAYGKYKLNPRSAADIELVPVYDTSEFNAPDQQVPGGEINIAQINQQELLPIIKFNIVDPGQDGLPTIVEYFRIKIEAENTIDFLNDIDSGAFILNNIPIWPISNPQIVGNMLEFYFGNNQFVVPNGQTYEMLIKILPKPSAAGKTMKISINTGNSIAYQPTVSSSPLKQVDEDIPSEIFTFIYETTKTNEITQSSVVYPNPANTVLYLPVQATKVEIYNNLGQKILEKLNSSEIEVKNLTNGLYSIRVYTSDGKVAVTKFIKN